MNRSPATPPPAEPAMAEVWTVERHVEAEFGEVRGVFSSKKKAHDLALEIRNETGGILDPRWSVKEDSDGSVTWERGTTTVCVKRWTVDTLEPVPSVADAAAVANLLEAIKQWDAAQMVILPADEEPAGHREKWLCWKEFIIPNGETEPRLITPWGDPMVYESPMDWLFETSAEAEIAKNEHAPDEDWVLVEMTLLVVAHHPPVEAEEEMGR